MYEEYLRDPTSVGQEWRELFENGKLAELPIIRGTGSQESGTEAAAPAVAPTPAPATPAPESRLLTPITGPAARLVANMTDSLSVPTATSFRDISATTLDARRKAINDARAASGKKISFTHLIGYA